VLSELTISHGRTTGTPGRGAGIFNCATTTLSHTAVLSNTASGLGGGIGSELGSLTVVNSTVRGNTAGDSGGRISAIFGSLVVSHSAIVSNSTSISGGGIYFAGPSLTVDQTSILSNTGVSDGGGIRVDTIAGRSGVTVTSSTIGGNRITVSNGRGGGIM